MNPSNRQRLLGYGLASDLIDSIAAHGLTLTEIKNTTQKRWRALGFSNADAKLIYDHVTRKPIPEAVVTAIVSKSNSCCCYCADGNSARPYQLHHMVEHHQTRDDSEANLLLVCPTHHVCIHENDLTISDQQEKKYSWEFRCELAQAFSKRGRLFPNGDFAPLLYWNEYDITEVFGLGVPSASVCKAVTTGRFAQEALSQLTLRHFLLLSGESGSGKSTFAVGTAGILAATGTRVFKFLCEGKSGQAVVQAVVEFTLVVRYPVVLLIDDANRLLAPSQIEQVLQAATPLVKIIVIVTRDQFASEGNVEQHFSYDAQHVDWLAVQPAVKASLLQHDRAVAQYISDHAGNLDSSRRFVGSGALDTPLDRLIDTYVRESKTAWQFMYLLGGGVRQVEKVRREQQSKDRFDLVLLRVALTQLAEFEKSMSLNELLDFYQTDTVLSRTYPPESEWLREQLMQLCHTRLLVTERGRYKTIHREFARAFLVATYQDATTRPDAIRLLNQVFDKPAVNVKQIVVLWSWFESSPLREYLEAWQNTTPLSCWQEMVKAACAVGLETVTFLAYYMHMSRLGVVQPLITKSFEKAGLELVVAAQQSKPGEGTFYLLHKLSTVLTTHCQEAFIALLEGLGTVYFIENIKQASCDEFDDISQVLLVAEELHPTWVESFPGTLSVVEVQQIAQRVEKGDWDSLFHFIGFQRRFLFQLTKSQLDFYVDRLSDLVRGCPLHRFHYSPMSERTLWELVHSPVRIQRLMDSLDMAQLAREYETAAPRHWGKLLTLAMLEERVGLNTMQHFVDELQAEALVENAVKYHEDTHAFRLMLHQLRSGSPTKRIELAIKLRPLVETILNKRPGEYDNDVLMAYTQLDPNQGEQVRAALGLVAPEIPARVGPSDMAEGIDYMTYWDSTGEDYLLPAHLVGSIKGEEDI